jgi:hypothetical protein
MKRNYLKLLSTAAFVICISLSGCQKLLEIEETDLIAGEIALKTVNNCEQGIIGAYAGLGVEMKILLNSTFSDEVRTTGEFYNAQTTHEWLYSSQDVGLRDNFIATNPNYRIIDRVNRVLQALPKADSTRVGDEVLRRRLRGEALFLRAYGHFELFLWYSKNYDPEGLAMPYMETPSLAQQERIKMGPYFTKILADLNEAKTLVPASLTDINRVNLPTANGLHARIALFMRDWATAETQATAFINAVPLATIAEFPGIWTDANTKELSLRLIRTATVGGRIGSLFRGVTAQGQIGTITWGPTGKLWDSYDKVNDVRFNAYFVDEPLLSSVGRTSRLIKKYEGSGYGTPNENVNNAKVFRTAEMMLIRAEARAEQGRFSGANSAETDINLLRSNRITGYTNTTFTSKDQAITEVLQERFKELCYEGNRFFDLKRRNLPVVRPLADAPAPNATTLAAGNFRFVLPIQLTDLQANPLLKQNEGY